MKEKKVIIDNIIIIKCENCLGYEIVVYDYKIEEYLRIKYKILYNNCKHLYKPMLSYHTSYYVHTHARI